MDWVFACGLTHFKGLQQVIISYDISCHWFVNLKKRMAEWPKDKQLPDWMELISLIPALHFPAHREEDHDEFNTRLCEGLGMLDLEAIERLWAAVGMLGVATRSMAPASRQLVLDDNFAFYNWQKYCNHGEIAHVLNLKS